MLLLAFPADIDDSRRPFPPVVPVSLTSSSDIVEESHAQLLVRLIYRHRLSVFQRRRIAAFATYPNHFPPLYYYRFRDF